VTKLAVPFHVQDEASSIFLTHNKVERENNRLIIYTYIYTHTHTHTNDMWSGITQSAEGLATGWTVRGSSPGGGGGSEIIRICPDRSWGGHPAFYQVSFPGVKRPQRGVDHPPPPHLAPRLKKEWRCTSTPPLGLRSLL